MGQGGLGYVEQDELDGSGSTEVRQQMKPSRVEEELEDGLGLQGLFGVRTYSKLGLWMGQAAD